MDTQLRQRIGELICEEITIVPYNTVWPAMFDSEAKFLRSKLPQKYIQRIEHFGSTAVSGHSAKPIIDLLAEVTSLDAAKEKIVPILIAEGYEHFWRSAFGDNGPPFYAWFIKRDSSGKRTHHIHMVEAGSELWDRICFGIICGNFPKLRRNIKH